MSDDEQYGPLLPPPYRPFTTDPVKMINEYAKHFLAQAHDPREQRNVLSHLLLDLHRSPELSEAGNEMLTQLIFALDNLDSGIESEVFKPVREGGRNPLPTEVQMVWVIAALIIGNLKDSGKHTLAEASEIVAKKFKKLGMATPPGDGSPAERLKKYRDDVARSRHTHGRQTARQLYQQMRDTEKRMVESSLVTHGSLAKNGLNNHLPGAVKMALKSQRT